MNIITESLWEAVPAFLRNIDDELVRNPAIGKPLPPTAAPITFASWMGGVSVYARAGSVCVREERSFHIMANTHRIEMAIPM
jgi:phosphoenolpyruvate carboxylase